MRENNLKEIVENILNREHKYSEKVKQGYFEEYKKIDKHRSFDEYIKDDEIIYLRKDIPEIINSGDTQAIIKLSDNYVAKIPIIKMSNHQLLHYYPNAITNSVNVWRELGFEVPQHTFYYTDVNEKIEINEQKIKKFDSPRVTITADLTENEKYKINTYKEKNILKLSNSKQLIEEFNNSFALIKEIEKKPIDYALMPHGHIDQYGSIDKAIRHMFLVQIDPKTNNGKLILGDIDHLFIYKLD